MALNRISNEDGDRIDLAIKHDIEKLTSLIPTIRLDRNYWFIRTGSGKFYDKFVKEKFIAIGYNEIHSDDIKLAQNLDRIGISQLKNRIATIRKTDKNSGKIASQLIKFTYQIKRGDIVFIPSEHSAILYFGEVEDNEIYFGNGDNECPYNKRKKVKWLKYKNKNELDAELYKLLFSHSIISNASKYATYIDRTLNNLFIKGDTTHLVLTVNTTQKISTNTFYDFGEIFKLAIDLCSEIGIDNGEDFNIKSKVQSQGIFEITNMSALGIIAVGTIIIGITGGGFSFSSASTKEKTTITAKVTSDGLIDKVRQFLNSKKNRELKADITKKALEDLKITTPEDLVKILNKFDEKK